MKEHRVHHTEHQTTVAAPAEAVYLLLADVQAWPLVFGPNVHTELVSRAGNDERIQLWATANGVVKKWTSRRVLDAAGGRIEFRQEVSQPPVAAMGGEWLVKPSENEETLVVLRHDFSAVGDSPENVEWITRAIDTNSRAELAALKRIAELNRVHDGLTFSFSDTLDIAGSPEDVYEFLRDAARWPERVPHVGRLDVVEDVPDIQTMAMDTRTPDGSTHTTESVRVCFPPSRIVYKQVVVPKLMLGHTGEWRVHRTTEGTTAVSRHSVILNPDRVTQVLGAAATVSSAREFVHTALSRNSTATLGYAKTFAEERAGKARL